MQKNNPKYIVVHSSDVSQDVVINQFYSINNYHRDERGFPISSLGHYVGYHRLITGGVNYKCREDTDEGAHCNQGFDGIRVYEPGVKPNLSMNFQSLGVCIGFDGDIEYPTQEHYNYLQKQVWAWQDKYNIPNKNVFFHRKFATNKTCPGSLITDAWLKQLLTRPSEVIPTYKTPTEKCIDENVIIKQDKNILLASLLNNKTNMQKFLNFFSGKKTYIVGILSIILGILNGDTELIMTGLGLMTLRAGVSKVI